MKDLIKSISRGFRYASTLVRTVSDAPMGFPPGHFYSPIPSIRAVLYRESQVYGHPDSLPGIDLNTEAQLETLATIVPLCQKQPFLAVGCANRFTSPNENFSP